MFNKDAARKELEAQLKEVPEFKSNKHITIVKGKGSDNPPTMTCDEEYRKRK